jgi:hypothetical protein
MVGRFATTSYADVLIGADISAEQIGPAFDHGQSDQAAE